MDTFTTPRHLLATDVIFNLGQFTFCTNCLQAPLSKSTNGSKKALSAATIEHLLKWHTGVKLKPAHDQIDTNTTTTGNGYRTSYLVGGV